MAQDEKASVRRVDMGKVRRIIVTTEVGPFLTKQTVSNLIVELVRQNRSEDAVAVAVTEKGQTQSVSSVAQATWAPAGLWENAEHGLMDKERATYRLQIDYREPYFSRKREPHDLRSIGMNWSKLVEMAEEIMREVSYAHKPIWERYPKGNPSALDAAEKSAKNAVFRKYGLSQPMGEKALEIYIRETYGR
jgi:hypothetical protein